MFGVLGALTGARRGPAGTIVWCRFTKVIQGVISNTRSAMMAVIVRSNMCRGFPQAVRMDYSGLDVGDGLLDHLADPVDVPGTRPGKDRSPAGGSLSTRLPRFAPPSRGSSRVEATEVTLTGVSDGPRRAAGRGPPTTAVHCSVDSSGEPPGGGPQRSPPR